jgi:hypothetical protein
VQVDAKFHYLSGGLYNGAARSALGLCLSRRSTPHKPATSRRQAPNFPGFGAVNAASFLAQRSVAADGEFRTFDHLRLANNHG